MVPTLQCTVRRLISTARLIRSCLMSSMALPSRGTVSSHISHTLVFDTPEVLTEVRSVSQCRMWLSCCLALPGSWSHTHRHRWRADRFTLIHRRSTSPPAILNPCEDNHNPRVAAPSSVRLHPGGTGCTLGYQAPLWGTKLYPLGYDSQPLDLCARLRCRPMRAESGGSC